jgi:hypothetical protein
MQLQRDKSGWNNVIFGTIAEIFPAGMKAQWDECGRRILLGDNTGRQLVTLRPIRAQCINVWISYWLCCIYTHSWPHVYSIIRLAQNSIWAGHCVCWEVSVLSHVCMFTIQVVIAVFYILSEDTSNMSYYTGGFRRKLALFGKTFLMLIWIDITVRTYTCLTSCLIRTVCNHSTSDIEFMERSPELRQISHEAPCVA